MAHIAVFDMNETTLDLTPVRAIVDDLLGPEGGFPVWFGRLLQLSMTTTTVGGYSDFGSLARSALDAVAATGGRSLPDDAWDRVGPAIMSVPPYPDVEDALRRLQEAGWSLISLTNSAPAAVNAQLDSAGLMPYFDHVISVDAVGAYKPVAAPYLHAADVAGSRPADMWMVACHDWDLAGARAVGMRTAFVSRPRMSYADAYTAPDVTVADFGELADELLAL